MATWNVAASPLQSLSVDAAVSATMIDEIPVLAVLASSVQGTSEFRGVGELRVKESDRLLLVTENLRRMGAQVQATVDDLLVNGGHELHGAQIQTDGDHRIAMAFAIAGLNADGETIIDNAECVSVSYPDFWKHFRQLAPDSLTLQA
jgi:3-phosphoshikimate 1-carboxyvinyltransferase